MEKEFAKMGAELIKTLAAKTQVSQSTLAMAHMVAGEINDPRARKTMASIGFELADVVERCSWMLCAEQLPPADNSSAEYLLLCRYKDSGNWEFCTSEFDPYKHAESGGFYMYGADEEFDVLAWKLASSVSAQAVAFELIGN